MLPISEVHFAFCGIATVAATLGYACARRAVFSFASSNEPSKADVEAGPPEERSLKRKLDDSDDHDVDAEEQSRPMKRNRTPPTEQHESDKDIKSHQEWEVIVAPTLSEKVPSFQQPEEPVQDNSTPSKGDPHSIEQDISPVLEPTPPAHPEIPSHLEEKGLEAGRCPTPQPLQVNFSPNEPETPPTRSITPPKPVASSKIEPVKAFSTFSVSSSPFGSYLNASGASPFALSGQIVKTTPAWRRDNESESDVFGRTSSTNALAPSPNDAVSSTTTKSLTLSQCKSTGETQSLVKSSTHLTGEEDEDVEAELKGVKLFVKRGRKEFNDGMYGHIKILSQKSTPPKTANGDPQGTETGTISRTRLLFRRDPLGQVSMNVGLHPTVTTDEKVRREDVVIYALKPGRAQKADFQSFAKTLCDHDGLKSGVVTSSPASAGGDAAAS